MHNLPTLAIILSPLIAGFFIPLPRTLRPHIDNALNALVYVILFLIGLSLAQVGTLDIAAISAAVALLFILSSGCNLMALIFFDRLRPWAKQDNVHQEGRARVSMVGSLLQLMALLLGYICAVFLPDAWLPPEHINTYALILLIFLVGLQLGGSGIPLHQILINRRGVETASVCILSALGGGLLFAAFYPEISWTQGLALASGFGWYSLSAIVITEAYGAVWGSVALLNDLLREFFALLFIPALMRRHASAAVGIGGATSLDFTLPLIQSAGGIAVVPLAISFGFLINLLSPLLMILFSSWS